MKILMWNVHGRWATSFVHGMHDVVVPVVPDRGPDGVGLPTTHRWPQTVRELTPYQLRDERFDLVILQRPVEIALVYQWLGRRPGIDLPAIYVEHDTPRSSATASEHLLADQTRIPIAHVTEFNALTWDNGRAPVYVVEHGIPDPGPLYDGMLARAAYVSSESVRRGRINGSDLLGRTAQVAPVDVFGRSSAELTTAAHRHEVVGHGDVAHSALHSMLASRRVYVHLCRWTSRGLSLLEAMYMGMPVVALSASEAPEALAGSAAIVSKDISGLQQGILDYLLDPLAAADAGRRNRAHVGSRFSLPRFHADWDRLLKEALA